MSLFPVSKSNNERRKQLEKPKDFKKCQPHVFPGVKFKEGIKNLQKYLNESIFGHYLIKF